MSLTKEQILTLTYLKDIGPKKIFAIGAVIKERNLKINSYEELWKLMLNMEEKAIRKVSFSDLNNAYLVAQKIIEESSQNGIDFIGYYDQNYPNLLRNTINEKGKLTPPLLLWYRGDLSITNLPGLSVIGTREATPEGIVGGTYLAGEFAKRGFNIISGLAIGCDTCGHKGALKVKGKTTAILANGLDNDSIYPSENKYLAEEIVQNGGLLISEYCIGTKAKRYNLVARDRLQAGLSLATLVIQTGVNGGTMHAATATLLSGKSLYAMYFKDDKTRQHERSLGNAFLVAKGAKYIRGDANFDEISENIKKWESAKTDLFE